MNSVSSRVSSLEHLPSILGLTTTAFVGELALLLYLWRARETETESELPSGYRWDDLRRCTIATVHPFYLELLAKLGTHRSRFVRTIFHRASSALADPGALRRIVDAIDALDWYEDREALAGRYVALLRTAADEDGSRAQHRTPQVLIDCMVACVQPEFGELIRDPSPGTGDFLVAAQRYAGGRRCSLDLTDVKPDDLVKRTRLRLLLTNLWLHDIEVVDHPRSKRVDVILSNPRFGSHNEFNCDDLLIKTRNLPLAVLQRIPGELAPGGCAAILVPNSALFGQGPNREVRALLMEACDVHTIVLLPVGSFPDAPTVKASILFITAGSRQRETTRDVWVHDLRSCQPEVGDRPRLTSEHLAELVASCTAAPPEREALLRSSSRWRRCSLEEIAEGCLDGERASSSALVAARRPDNPDLELSARLAAAFCGELTAEWRADHPVTMSAVWHLGWHAEQAFERWSPAHEDFDLRIEPAGQRRSPPIANFDLEMFRGFAVPDLPKTWCWASLDALRAEDRPLRIGIGSTGESVIGGVPLLRTGDLDHMDRDRLRTIAAGLDAAHPNSRLRGGEVVLSVAGTVGKVAIAPFSFGGVNVSRTVISIAPSNAVRAEWLASWLRSPLAQAVLKRDDDTQQPTFNLGRLRHFPVPVAPLAEQNAVLAQLASPSQLTLWSRR